MSRALFLAATLLAAAACGRSKEERAAADSAEVASRLAKLTQLLADTTGRVDQPLAKWILPEDMSEISGIVLTPDGTHVIGHGDEMAHLVSIDWRTGVVSKRFELGDRAVPGDFEGIARAGLDYYMLTSKAEIYHFREPADTDRTTYTKIDTKLGSECEFEGIAHDPLTNSLLMACKRPKKVMRDSLVIFRWPLGVDPEPVSRITVPVDIVIGSNDWSDVHPSDITIDPITGNYVLVARQENALIVISRDGQVVSSGPIATNIGGAEGVAITRDGVLIISAEAEKTPASLTLFRWRP